MAKYRPIQTCFWEDTKVLDEMDCMDRYFYLYLLTNPHVNQCGCYEISVTQIANESGIEKKEVLKLLDRFENELKVIKQCPKTKEILLVNFYKYNWTTSPKVKTCIEKEISMIKSQDLKGYIYPILKKIYPMDTASQEKEKEKEKEKQKEKKEEKEERKKATAFTSSPIFDFSLVLDYGLSKGTDESYCQKFFDYYSKKKKKWEDEKEWKEKFDDWYKEDYGEEKETKLIKMGEGSFRI